MPYYEFRCRRCGSLTPLLEERGERKFFWQRRCGRCRSWRLERVYSPCAVTVSRSTPDLLNELSRMGPVNFVPAPLRPSGPPPGGCPYCQSSPPSSPGREASDGKPGDSAL